MGGGFRNFNEFCGGPALCNNCGTFAQLNYLEDDPRCEKCGHEVTFYDSPELQGEKISDYPGFCWDMGDKVMALPDVFYKCPSCGEKRMRFVHEGCWD